jgi:peroxiredoxin
MRRFTIVRTALPAFIFALSLALLPAAQPKVGDKAADFSLQTLDDQTIRLSNLTSNTPVVLLVLRGWPGYQCPICTAQVKDYVSSADAFDAAGARVIMVYPGPAVDLKAHAAEFLKSKEWPKQFLFVTDPDYKMVNSYDLRWNSPNETSYPSTFILDRKGIIRFAKVSRTHGDRTKAAGILAKLKELDLH